MRPTEVGVGGGRIAVGVQVELMSFVLSKVGYKVISCEGGGEGRGGEGGGEGRREHGKQFPGVRGRGVDLCLVDLAADTVEVESDRR